MLASLQSFTIVYSNSIEQTHSRQDSHILMLSLLTSHSLSLFTLTHGVCLVNYLLMCYCDHVIILCEHVIILYDHVIILYDHVIIHIVM